MSNGMAERYISLYKKLHEEDIYYGTSSIRWLPLVLHYVSDLNPDSILDYGCGKSSLASSIETLKSIPSYRYDPAIPEYSVLPTEKAGMILNIDVMEHIPEDSVDDVLAKICGLSGNAFFNISCVEAWNKLPDGSNAHCTVHPAWWWERKLKKYFDHVERVAWPGDEIAIFVTWRVKSHYVLRYRILKKIRRSMINVICLFIPVRRWRRYLRDRFFYF
jgi:hypothetical protein